MMVDISNFTAAKILDERLRVEYRCELKLPWLIVDLVEKAKMGTRSHSELQKWSHTGKPSRDVEGEKGKLSEM